MKKFIVTSNGKEIKIGDVITVTEVVKTPFTVAKIDTAIKVTEEMLPILIKEGKVKIIEESNPDISKILAIKVWANTWKSLVDKTGLSSKGLALAFDVVEKVNPWAVVQVILKEIAIELDKQYDNHISNSKKIYAISPQDGKIHEINKKTIKSYKAFPAFRTVEDAKIACSLLKNHLKSIFEDVKKK